MPFIAKNPLIIPKINHTPSVPSGTRGIFVGEDGWYAVDENGKVDKVICLSELAEIISSLQIVKTATVSLFSSEWVQIDNNQYSQVVTISDVTPYSKIDLQPTAEQLAIFYEKDVSFVAENNNGTVTIYCIGQQPANDYDIQATITEVVR